jgi:uncharacterized membrane protein YdjX (TVP38/TMEM64 family)
VLDNGLPGPVLFVLVFSLAVSALFPVLPFVFVGAVTYGLWGGTLLNVAGTVLGASLAYAAARTFGAGLLRRSLPRGWGDTLERLLQRQPTYAVFVLRVLPFFPYAPTSFALGLTQVRFRAFLWGTLAGSVPLTLVYSSLFARAGAVLRRPGARLTELLTLESALPFGARPALCALAPGDAPEVAPASGTSGRRRRRSPHRARISSSVKRPATEPSEVFTR